MIEQLQDLAIKAENGELNALRVYIHFKKIEKELTSLISAVQPLAVDIAYTYPEKQFEIEGVKVSKSSGRGQWKYEQVHQIADLSQKIATYQQLAKEAAKGVEIFDKEGLQVLPAVYVAGKDSISVTI